MIVPSYSFSAKISREREKERERKLCGIEVRYEIEEASEV